jgi:hypothetical protein
MKCDRVRGLFGAFWDDETTQAERELLEAHFAGCEECRREYEVYSRALELAGALPRVDAAPDLVDRVLARARRTASVPDGVEGVRPRWVLVASTAALLALAGAALVPLLRTPPPPSQTARATPPVLREPVLVTPPGAPASGTRGKPAVGDGSAAGGSLASLGDSLFDHSEDVEFILDPVTLRRGHAHAVTSAPAGVRAERAVVSF